MGIKYDDIISEIKGNLSEEEIYTRANESLHEGYYFCKNLGCLKKWSFTIYKKKWS